MSGPLRTISLRLFFKYLIPAPITYVWSRSFPYYPVRVLVFDRAAYSKSHATLDRAVSALPSGSTVPHLSLLPIAIVLIMTSRLQQIHRHLSDRSIMSGGRS